MKKILWKEFTDPGQKIHGSLQTIQTPVEEHTHDFAEVFMVCSGRGSHILNGEEQRIEKGDLIMVRPRDCHSIVSDEKDYLTMINAAFPEKSLDFLFSRYFSRRKEFWNGRYKLSENQSSWIQSNFEHLCFDEYSALGRDLFLLSLLGETERLSKQRDFSGCPDWLGRACRQMNHPDHFRRGVSAMVDISGRTPEHLSRALKKYTGQTPVEMVTSIRMEYAAARLRTGTDPILDIALDCGYTSLSHFYVTFNKVTGMPPRQYRLKQQTPFPQSVRRS